MKVITSAGKGNKGPEFSGVEAELIWLFRTMSESARRHYLGAMGICVEREMAEMSRNRPALRLVAGGAA